MTIYDYIEMINNDPIIKSKAGKVNLYFDWKWSKGIMVLIKDGRSMDFKIEHMKDRNEIIEFANSVFGG